MAKKEKKTNQTGLALACWILGFLILLIVFLVKQDEIYSNLKTTRFFERIFGSTPEFIANHEVKEEPQKEEPRDRHAGALRHRDHVPEHFKG